jgi:hypothetical protein
MNKITFHSNRLYNRVKESFRPIPSKSYVPKWYSSADRYEKIPGTEDYYLNPEGGKMFSFKGCPALLDVFTSGYLYVTPCDITFYKEGEITKVKTEQGFEDFCASRPATPNLEVPEGYQKEHFHWYPNWAPSLPEGYSALYVSPLNRFELPFITTAGIIDNDKMDTPGLMPFFLRDDFVGTIPAGTPYVQIIPFKREDWEMDFKFYEYNEIIERHEYQAKKFRTKNGGAYKEHVWSKKKYK